MPFVLAPSPISACFAVASSLNWKGILVLAAVRCILLFIFSWARKGSWGEQVISSSRWNSSWGEFGTKIRPLGHSLSALSVLLNDKWFTPQSFAWKLGSFQPTVGIHPCCCLHQGTVG